ncbi:DUF2911 domain-containing protein [uncultured Polaribacter sp.]|uniref:DUF2911 domain-containing protein n=1 Tax=uncultured Polaribacter sp. TaxID=174711 RepID=UPI0026358737|nr:DUF2911 domain-containing protein [uncultured Polaribacter sp.]
MKQSILFLCILILMSCKDAKKEVQDKTQQTEIEQKTTSPITGKKKPLSPHSSTMAMIGDAHIHIDYSSPGVRDRIIFGGLVGYSKVWQAGAHNATWIETNKELTIAGEVLPAGKYGFFTIPSKEDWTVMINKNWEQHGKDEYDEKDDVIRFKVTPKISENIQEHLAYKVTKTSENSGTISMTWEKVHIEFPFTVN